MDRGEVEDRLYAVLEDLACVEHKGWSHWQRYLHSKGRRMDDGSIVIPSDLVKRWELQMTTEYHLLSEQEKESDRKQVLEFFPILIKALNTNKV